MFVLGCIWLLFCMFVFIWTDAACGLGILVCGWKVYLVFGFYVAWQIFVCLYVVLAFSVAWFLFVRIDYMPGWGLATP